MPWCWRGVGSCGGSGGRAVVRSLVRFSASLGHAIQSVFRDFTDACWLFIWYRMLPLLRRSRKAPQTTKLALELPQRGAREARPGLGAAAPSPPACLGYFVRRMIKVYSPSFVPFQLASPTTPVRHPQPLAFSMKEQSVFFCRQAYELPRSHLQAAQEPSASTSINPASPAGSHPAAPTAAAGAVWWLPVPGNATFVHTRGIPAFLHALPAQCIGWSWGFRAPLLSRR